MYSPLDYVSLEDAFTTVSRLGVIFWVIITWASFEHTRDIYQRRGGVEDHINLAIPYTTWLVSNRLHRYFFFPAFLIGKALAETIMLVIFLGIGFSILWTGVVIPALWISNLIASMI